MNLPLTDAKTTTLTGLALRWAMHKALGNPVRVDCGDDPWALDASEIIHDIPAYESDWAHGGPLRDKYRVAIYDIEGGLVAATLRGDNPPFWIDEAYGEADATGDTALIAMRRAILRLLYGEFVIVPTKLLGRA